MNIIVSLSQTLLWLGIFGFLYRRYDALLRDVLSALRTYLQQDRSTTSPALPELRPLEPEAQLEKVTLDLAEVVAAPAITGAPLVREAAVSKQVHAKYVEAQDLALRAIQAEYGVSVGRQLTGGADIGFDGVFSHEGKLNIVEVKFVSALFNEKSMKQSVDRITAAIIRYGWLNVRIVLVVVSENGEGFGAKIAALRKHLAANPVPVVVTFYSLSELRARNAVLSATAAQRVAAE